MLNIHYRKLEVLAYSFRDFFEIEKTPEEIKFLPVFFLLQ